jgi:hypothetical protein
VRIGDSLVLEQRPPVWMPAVRRALKHPRLMPYHRLIAAVALVNLAAVWLHGAWRIDDGSALAAAADLMLLNLAAAVLIRQQLVLNVLFGLAGRGSSSWPLWLRWSVSKVHHVGGIHAGGALAGTAWLVAFAVLATVTPGVATSTIVLAYGLVALLLAVVAGAAPAAGRSGCSRC